MFLNKYYLRPHFPQLLLYNAPCLLIDGQMLKKKKKAKPYSVKVLTDYFALTLLKKFRVLIPVKIIINAEYINHSYDAVGILKKDRRDTSGACSLLFFMYSSTSLSFSSFTAFKAFL